MVVTNELKQVNIQQIHNHEQDDVFIIIHYPQCFREKRVVCFNLENGDSVIKMWF